MTFIVIAAWTAQPGEELNVLDSLRELANATRCEQGCIQYEVNRESDNPRRFVLYEKYASKADYEAHAASSHFRRFAIEDGIPRLESRERTFLEPAH